MNLHLERLSEITARLIHTESHGENLKAVQELHGMLSGITKLADENPLEDDEQETILREGKAISPRDAARCTLDFRRTRQFMSGVRAAVIEAQRRFPAQTIQILYAGCGPFAPLVLPLTAEFTAAQIQFTLLDIHRRSLEAVRQIVETLGLSDYVLDYVQADATSYKHPRHSAPHIIVTEMLQKALVKEPQVAMTRNLAPQLREGGIFIPQQITLRASLAVLGKEILMLNKDGSSPSEAHRARIDLGEIYKLTAESSQQLEAWWVSLPETPVKLCSPAVRLRIPQVTDDTYRLMILTNIIIFNSIALGDYESGVTYPTMLNELGCIGSPAQIEFCYVTGEDPGLRYRLLAE